MDHKKQLSMTHTSSRPRLLAVKRSFFPGLKGVVQLISKANRKTRISIAGPGEVINYYLLSLASADLLCGLLVVPLSVYPALMRRWVYGDIVCRLVGYLEVTLWAISVYTFMWISVDRYLAIRFDLLLLFLKCNVSRPPTKPTQIN